MAFHEANAPIEQINYVILLYGQPGVGKSTLAMSAPGTVTLDFDGGLHRVNARHRKESIDTSHGYEGVLKDLEDPRVQNAQTIIIDTGGALVTYMKDWAYRTRPGCKTRTGAFNNQKGYGEVKNEITRLASYIRDTMHKNLVWVFHANEQMDNDGNSKWVLQCEGSTRNTVWNSVDFGGFMYTLGGKTVIGFSPCDEYTAKGCHGIEGVMEVPRLAKDSKNDFLTRLLEQAQKNIETEQAEANADNDRYEAVMEEIRSMIDAVDDSDSANMAAAEIPKMNHVKTSKTEAAAMLNRKAAQIGLKWSREAGGYVSVEG